MGGGPDERTVSIKLVVDTNGGSRVIVGPDGTVVFLLLDNVVSMDCVSGCDDGVVQ